MSEKTNERVGYKKKFSDSVEICIDEATIHGLPLTYGDEIEVRIRGRAREELKCMFKCYNKLYGTILCECEGWDYLLKLSHIVWIRKIAKKE